MIICDTGTLVALPNAVDDHHAACSNLFAMYPGRLIELCSARREFREKPQRTLSLGPVTAELAADLLMDAAELEKIRDPLWERRQVIFHGPPGTAA